ncbi:MULTISPECIES: hypothetical protein [unclassified Tolypothrix]|uniref:hypothetical protein n=1 Tax=unclassified Tolypothrix TaxID=2649714 RepID=UPI0005EAA335|nr:MULTISPECIES: hypothetical protein [unclassified Tolypothrix]BAY90780.1 hypothetical protein NIES3275_27970 [Microchaete diplosiphon NIES-3275]EKF04377.1 hypothetical protein FDUTEX481_02056 [Tolypothrix sp. PCC 7601]MBE9081022.1 hypothetical protein [Tolypothrix sp. LEGE 11397]UYD24912.1 hypothetical protein HGR01_26365 [Tolypothrix sp. PCC 7712]UYD32855.1 hypothetical protein HG267_28270 [Tolypothrix sp. PCC 7601]
MELTPKTIIYGVSALGTVASLIGSGGNMGNSLDALNRLRAANQQEMVTSAELERAEASRKQQTVIANSRYKACELIVAGGGKQKITFPAINPNTIVTDRNTGTPLVRGTTICDAYGNTAILNEQGKATAFAFTGDRNAVQIRMKRYRGGLYAQPVAGGQQ